MIEAIQVAAMDAAKANPAASPAAQPQAPCSKSTSLPTLMLRAVRPPVARAPQRASPRPAQPSQGMRALLSTFENLNGGADSINSMSQTMTQHGEPVAWRHVADDDGCHQFLFKAELTSNVANRTSDGVQQLFRSSRKAGTGMKPCDVVQIAARPMASCWPAWCWLAAAVPLFTAISTSNRPTR